MKVVEVAKLPGAQGSLARSTTPVLQDLLARSTTVFVRKDLWQDPLHLVGSLNGATSEGFECHYDPSAYDPSVDSLWRMVCS
jgi:hypothetical protein